MKSKGQKESQKHEARLAKKFDGQRSAASGAFWSRKGDVRSQDLLIEHKWTGKASFTVKAAILEKIVNEAIVESRMPILGISLNNNNYILLTEDDFEEMRQLLQECTCTKMISDMTKAGVTTQSVEGWTPSSGIHQEIKANIKP
jgi:hypothetical protein